MDNKNDDQSLSKLILPLIGFAVAIFLSFQANAEGYNIYSNWSVDKVVDGDTLKVEIPELPTELKSSVRVLGVDTPEKYPRAKCPEEHKKAIEAKAFTKNLIDNADQIVFTEISWDKYGGRILGEVVIDGKNLSDELIKAGLAREYHGKKKQGWCK